MTKALHRFFVSPDCISAHHVVIKDRAQVHQLTRVLRMRPGQELIVLDGLGNEYHAKLDQLAKDQVIGSILTVKPAQGELPFSLRLFQGLPKQLSKFEEVLRHGTELDITEFYPLLTQNTELPEIRKRDRLEAILKESAEQSERGKIPVLGPEIDFSKILQHGWPEELNAEITLLAYERESERFLADVLPSLSSVQSINLIIGPEGGFTKEEIDSAHKNSFTVFGLGPRILRTETAALAVVSALLFGSSSPHA